MLFYLECWSNLSQLIRSVLLYFVGVVPSNKNMKCGFVYLPSFDSPSSAEYELYVGNVDQQENFKNFTVLHLNAEV